MELILNGILHLELAPHVAFMANVAFVSAVFGTLGIYLLRS
jgi:hypothetical protein